MTRHITGEYAEAFKGLYNPGTHGKLHEELGTSRSNRDKKDMKEYLYSQCQNPVDLDEVPDHLMNITTGQIASCEVED